VPSESATIAGTDANQIAGASHDDQPASQDPGDDNDDGAVEGPMVVAYVDLARKVGKYKTNLNLAL
jgi:hypothetical protein